MKIYLLILTLLMSPMASAQIFGMRKGDGGSEVQGSASGQDNSGAPGLESCEKPIGVAAIVEPQSLALASLQNYQLQSPTSLIRLMIQQSNCFVVVERGLAMQSMMQERDLNSSNQLRTGSGVGDGQMVSADFAITPSVVINDRNAGGAGIGAAIGGAFGGIGSAAGALIGAAAKTKEAQTTLLVTDIRSGLQVAAAEGSAKKSDFGIGGVLGGVGLGGYTSTDQGKVVAASFLDNYNNIVISLKSRPDLHREVELGANTDRSETNSSAFEIGAILIPKLSKLPVYDAPNSDATVLYEVEKSDGVIFLGNSENGYLEVEGVNGAGWIRELLATAQ